MSHAKNHSDGLYKSYKYMILLTRLIFFDKWSIITLSHDIKTEIDPFNNYIVKFQTKDSTHREMTMINIFNSIIDKIIITLNSYSIDDTHDPDTRDHDTRDHDITNNQYINIKYMLDVNYFKSTLTAIFKKIVYSILTSFFIIYKNKKEQYTDPPLSCNDIYQSFSDVNLKDLIKFIKLFYKESYIYIINYTQEIS